MPIDPVRQLTILLYEYFYFNGAKLEKEYIELLERHYNNMFQRFPERYTRDDELLEIIRKKVEFEEFVKIQSDIYKILKSFDNSADFSKYTK